MIYLDNIVKAINEKIEKTFSEKRFKGSIYLGVSSVEESGGKKIPKDFLNEKIIAFDDGRPLQMFHIINNSTSSKVKGNGNFDYIKKTINLSLVGLVNYHLCKLRSYEVESLIDLALNELALTQMVGLRSLSIDFKGSNFNQVGLLQSYFNSSKVALKAEIFSTNYIIEAVLDSTCINNCNC